LAVRLREAGAAVARAARERDIAALPRLALDLAELAGDAADELEAGDTDCPAEEAS
jgi:hypothetical protein